MKFNNKSAIDYIVQEFPELTKEIYDETWDGLLHIQMGVFSHLAISLIKDRRTTEFKHVCSVALMLMDNGEDMVTNAINVSFLENIEFQTGPSNVEWLRTTMPKRLLKAYDAMKEYNDRIHGKRS